MVQFDFLNELLGLLERNVATDSVQDDVQFLGTDSSITVRVEKLESLNEVLYLLDGKPHFLSKGFLIDVHCALTLESRARRIVCHLKIKFD